MRHSHHSHSLTTQCMDQGRHIPDFVDLCTWESGRVKEKILCNISCLMESPIHKSKVFTLEVAQ